MGNENVYRYFLWALAKKYWQAKGNGELNSDSLEEFNRTQNNDLSILKVLKLQFLATAAQIIKTKNTDILDKFGQFKALPYGPVDVVLYNLLRNDRLTNLSAGVHNLQITNIIDENVLAAEERELINSSISIMMGYNPELINLEAKHLVKLTHRWPEWDKPYSFAESLGRKSALMHLDRLTSNDVDRCTDKYWKI